MRGLVAHPIAVATDRRRSQHGKSKHAIDPTPYGLPPEEQKHLEKSTIPPIEYI